MRTAGIVIFAWLGLSLTLAAFFALFGAWRDRQARQRARGFLAAERRLLAEDDLVRLLDEVWALPAREHA
jgi:hypothetical protein